MTAPRMPSSDDETFGDTIPVGSTPTPDGDGDGDDCVTNLGDICPECEGGPGR